MEKTANKFKRKNTAQQKVPSIESMFSYIQSIGLYYTEP